jgi:hypothetical protein
MNEKALEFMCKFAVGHRIVSSNYMNPFQINEAMVNGKFFVDDVTGFGWGAIPWEYTTEMDRNREKGYFTRKGMLLVTD